MNDPFGFPLLAKLRPKDNQKPVPFYYQVHQEGGWYVAQSAGELSRENEVSVLTSPGRSLLLFPKNGTYKLDWFVRVLFLSLVDGGARVAPVEGYVVAEDMELVEEKS